MNNKKPDFYTIALIPHSPEQKTLVLKVPKIFAKMFLAFFVVVSAVLISTFVFSSRVARRVASYEDAKSRMLVQDTKIKKFEDQTRLIGKELEELGKRESELRKMLGLRTEVKNMKLTSEAPAGAEDIEKKLERINTNLKERQDSIERLMVFAGEFRKRFSSVPSIWPTYGRIVSSFGYRIFPWRGFHSGIDISGNHGTPIKSAADGVVEYAGWRTGYGKTVIVDHGFGYKTLYAHTSSFAVPAGTRVKKGQVIAYVGATGYATGAHLHYEVIRHGSKINPAGYLDLNIAGSLERRL